MCLWKWSHSVPSKLAISTIRAGNRCIEIDDILPLLNILSLPFQLYSPALFCSMFWGVDLHIVWTGLHCLSALGWNGQLEEPRGDGEDREVGVFILWFTLCVSLFEVTAPVAWPLLRTVNGLQEPFYLLPVVAYPRMPHHPLWFPLTCSTFCEYSLYLAIFKHPFRVGCLFPACHCF